MNHKYFIEIRMQYDKKTQGIKGLAGVTLALKDSCDACALGLITGSQELEGLLRSQRKVLPEDVGC